MTMYQRWGALTAPLLLALAGLARPARCQVPVPDTTPLSFIEIPAGASLASLASRLRALGGNPPRCVRSTRDRSVSECRGSFRPPGSAAPVALWLSAIDSLAGIITFQHTGNSERLNEWRNDLERRYGIVPTQVQGNQWMKQWVRRGRMIRLTWRRESGGTSVSVSLVDGRVLDGWGRSKSVNGER
jgi:hypothetical protein